MVRVPAPNGTTYCIDSTEVTNGHYAGFVASKGSDVSGQDSWCSWNTTYTPSGGWPATGKEDHPVAYVDWCDAYAYCKWAGKRLCGKIGGGRSAYGDYADATKSEWFNVCSVGGTLTYPYGSTYSGLACNGSDNGEAATVPVGSKATCKGGYAGLFDLSGNVAEWEDSCNGTAGPDDACRLRGGSFRYGLLVSSLRCDDPGTINRSISHNPEFGFRCCAE
jgi:formylglycine-generating enzyme required for sulfatase activity